MPEPDQTDLAYAAGIIDGEGSVCIIQLMPNGRDRKSPYIQAFVTVAMTDDRIPKWLAETFGGKATTSLAPSQRKAGRKPVTTWRLTSDRAGEFCSLIRPYMRLKHRQADLLCELLSDQRISFKRSGGKGKRLSEDEIELRLEYWTRMRGLNLEGRALSEERMVVQHS